MRGKHIRQPKGKSAFPVKVCVQPEEQGPVESAELMFACEAVVPRATVLEAAVSGGAGGAPDMLELMRESEKGAAALASVLVPLSTWHLCGDAVIGLAHRRKGLPCQDAITWRSSPRPILALSDGAGSAAVSELGARAMVIGVSRFLMSLEDDLVRWLDETAETPSDQMKSWAGRLLRHAQGVLDDLAKSERRNVCDLRGTLLLAVIGMRQVFWWQVGDGAIVIRQSEGLRALGSPAKTKGEFANQTCFVDIADIGMVQYGILPTSELTGLALLSDGGAEKLVAHDGSRVAARLHEWFDAVANDYFSSDKIALAFHEPAMWERTNLDDRSVVFAARRMNSSEEGADAY